MNTEDHTKLQENTYIGLRSYIGTQSGLKKKTSVNITASQVSIEGRLYEWSMLAMNLRGNPQTIIEIYGQRQNK